MAPVRGNSAYTRRMHGPPVNQALPKHVPPCHILYEISETMVLVGVQPLSSNDAAAGFYLHSDQKTTQTPPQQYNGR